MHSGTGHWINPQLSFVRSLWESVLALTSEEFGSQVRALGSQTSQIGLGHVVPPSYKNFPFNLIRTETDPQAASFTQHLEGQEMEIN